MRHERFTAEAVRHALDGKAEDLFELAWGPPQKAGAREWRAKTSSGLAMVMQGPRRGLWQDHKGGEGGDLLDFFAVHVLGLPNARADFPRVLAEAGAWCGLRPDEPVDLSAFQARREAREAQAAAEERAVVTRKADLVAELVRRAQPVHGSPAATYVARRDVTRFPATELAYGPACPDLRGLGDGRRYGALVVWARDDAGTVVGGQRILIRPDGSRAPETNRKPSFGRVSGFPARFPATSSTALPGPLVVAEGPETALSIWLATGLETWAVFGAGFFLGAPLPTNRKVILAPDRDPPGSPAARAYARAVAHHLAQGVDLWQAQVPELQGSKRDLNDTLRRAGEAAVREAVAAAGSLRLEPLQPFHEMPGRSREEALGRHASTVAEFFADARRRAWAARDVKEAYADLDPELDPSKRRAAQLLMRRETQSRYGLDYLPTAELRASQEPPRIMLGGAQGVGKTRATEAGLLASVGMVSLALVPDHAKAEELAASLRQQVSHRTPAVERVRGREARDEGAPGLTMCRMPKAAKALAERGLSVPATLCVRCPFRGVCGYIAQETRLARLAQEPAGLIVVAPREYWSLPLPGHLQPELVVFGEVPPNLGYKAVSLSFDTLGEPLTYDGPKRRKGRVAATAEAADAGGDPRRLSGDTGYCPAYAA